MFETGLVSISFRDKSPQTIITEVCRAGLGGIEWGGDVHVPPKNLENARMVGEMTRAAGLKVISYGSYYRLGCSANPGRDFRAVLDTAYALGTAVVRIWAGNKGSSEVTQEQLERLREEAFELALMADGYGIDIGLECHHGTLTDTWQSSLDFLRKVNHPRLKMYWQPNQFKSVEYNKKAAEVIAPYSINIHVFHWDAEKRYPLEEGEGVWKLYLQPFLSTGKKYGLLLEFMHDNRIESLMETSKTLLKWL